MKTLIFCLLILSAATGNLLAQGAQGVLIKNKAKDIRDNNNASQGVATPGAPAAGAVPAGPRGIDPVQQQNIDKLGEDLGLIKPGVSVSAEQKKTLQGDLTILAKSEPKPSLAALSKLTDDLAEALAAKPGAGKSQPQLAKALNVIVNSSKLTPGQVRMFLTNAQNALLDAGVPAAKLQAVIDDLKAITTELQPNKPKPVP